MWSHLNPNVKSQLLNPTKQPVLNMISFYIKMGQHLDKSNVSLASHLLN